MLGASPIIGINSLSALLLPAFVVVLTVAFIALLMLFRRAIDRKMPRQKTRERITLALAIVCVLALGGCAGMVKELSQDSAVVGVTGFWASIGGGVSPASPMPIPSVSFGYGTIWRIGKHDNVAVRVNSKAGSDAAADLEIAATNNDTPPAPPTQPKASIP